MSTCQYMTDEEIEISPFFQIVDRLADLYVSYRKRFVTMSRDGIIFIQNQKHGDETIPVPLTNRILCAHMNQQLAVSVFAGEHSAKFLCFDVDDGNLDTVKKIMDICSNAGIPRSKIYVSSSGGKGYHVEIFFSSLVYVSKMKDFYDWVCYKGDLDKNKVEFRPTHSHAIKLPLSKNFKTGNVCWFLDRTTFQPIPDARYILSIEKFSAEDFYPIVERARRDYHQNAPLNMPTSLSVSHLPLSGIVTCDELPMLSAIGETHKTILAIAIHLRSNGLSSEAIVKELNDWYDRQDPKYITDDDMTVRRDIQNAAKWVFSDKFKVKTMLPQFPTITKADAVNTLAQKNKNTRYVYFLMLYYHKKYGKAKLSYDFIARLCGISSGSALDAVERLIESKVISKRVGKAHMQESSFVKERNSYWVTNAVSASSLQEDSVVLDDLTDKNFRCVYYSTLLKLVDRATLRKSLSRSEYKKLEEYNEYVN